MHRLSNPTFSVSPGLAALPSSLSSPSFSFGTKTTASLTSADHPENQLHPPPASLAASAYIRSMPDYQAQYAQSIADPPAYWHQQATELIHWQSQPSQASTLKGSFEAGKVEWFTDGRLNAAENCIDRHVARHGDKVALLWESDDGKSVREITYKQLQAEVNKLANALRQRGVRKGDHVAIYMPMVPEAVFAMLACARLGAVHSVVFAGFSSDALRDRIVDGECRFVVTADEGRRGGKTVPLKTIVDKALQGAKGVEHVIVYQNTKAQVSMQQGRDEWYHDVTASQPATCASEVVSATDPLFMLYTSGSTGKPKGIVHATGSYLTYVTATTKYVFDLHDTDRYACVADVGWITGHSYIVYGPLSVGATTFLFEGIPTYPSASRYWEMVDRHKLSVFYTSPTAIRTLMKSGDAPVAAASLASLRILGSVGEPINPEAWRWLYSVVGRGRCSIVDTYWQTETGGIVMTPLPGATPQKPGSCTFPFFGIEPVLLDDKGGVVEGNDVSGLLAINKPWPGLASTIYGDHERYVKTYLTESKGRYVTGDGARRDRDGYMWITGRVDDVINVSGHRIGSAEVESAMVLHASVSEAACIGVQHDTKGQGLFCFVIEKDGTANSASERAQLSTELRKLIRDNIGPFAAPDWILVTGDVPKTRSGKIMRRLLRKIAEGETELGDTSTLADESVVGRLVQQVKQLKEGAAKGDGKGAAKVKAKL